MKRSEGLRVHFTSYHAAKHAEQLGYWLALANNSDGRVCFELASVMPAKAGK